LVGWEFDIAIFFKFGFYGVIWPHDPCHGFKRLYHVGFGLSWALF
jgi:hypothetical protein